MGYRKSGGGAKQNNRQNQVKKAQQQQQQQQKKKDDKNANLTSEVEDIPQTNTTATNTTASSTTPRNDTLTTTIKTTEKNSENDGGVVLYDNNNNNNNNNVDIKKNLQHLRTVCPTTKTTSVVCCQTNEQEDNAKYEEKAVYGCSVSHISVSHTCDTICDTPIRSELIGCSASSSGNNKNNNNNNKSEKSSSKTSSESIATSNNSSSNTISTTQSSSDSKSKSRSSTSRSGIRNGSCYDEDDDEDDRSYGSCGGNNNYSADTSLPSKKKTQLKNEIVLRHLRPLIGWLIEQEGALGTLGGCSMSQTLSDTLTLLLRIFDLCDRMLDNALVIAKEIQKIVPLNVFSIYCMDRVERLDNRFDSFSFSKIIFFPFCFNVFKLLFVFFDSLVNDANQKHYHLLAFFGALQQQWETHPAYDIYLKDLLKKKIDKTQAERRRLFQFNDLPQDQIDLFLSGVVV
jgi:hypothetical protein